MLIIALLLFPINSYADDKQEFCVGFKDGYILAYKEKSKSNVLPNVPVCPTVSIHKNNLTYYQAGFIIGYNNKK